MSAQQCEARRGQESTVGRGNHPTDERSEGEEDGDEDGKCKERGEAA